MYNTINNPIFLNTENAFYTCYDVYTALRLTNTPHYVSKYTVTCIKTAKFQVVLLPAQDIYAYYGVYTFDIVKHLKIHRNMHKRR